MRHRRITIHFVNDELKELVIDEHGGVRTDDSTPRIVRFGRTDTTRWAELLAAPESSILYWD